MKKYIIYTIFIATIFAVMVFVHLANRSKIGDAYVRGYKDGGNYVTSVFFDANRRAQDSCDVIAIPRIIEKDTVVYFLTSKYCDQLDTVISDRFKRGN